MPVDKGLCIRLPYESSISKGIPTDKFYYFWPHSFIKYNILRENMSFPAVVYRIFKNYFCPLLFGGKTRDKDSGDMSHGVIKITQLPPFGAAPRSLRLVIRGHCKTQKGK